MQIAPPTNLAADRGSDTKQNDNIPLVIIQKPGFSWNVRGRELWAYRELIYFLTWRDIKVRYKQTLLGVLWAVIQPLFIALTLSLFLGKLAKVPSDGVPYPVFAYSAMVLWQLFSHALTEASNSLVGNERLITKVYFPRLVIPLSAVLGGLVDFVIAFVVLIPFMAFYRIVPTAKVLFLPFFGLLTALIAFGAGLWLATLNVQYRDVRYTVPFLVQLWFLATPVAYPTSVVPRHWQAWYGLNPMVGVTEGFRWALLEAGQAPGHLLVGAVIVTAVVLGSGLYYFRQMEAWFADVI